MPIVNSQSVKPVRAASHARQGKLAIGVLIIVVVLVAVAYRYFMPTRENVVIHDYDTALVVRQDLVQTAQATGTTQILKQMIIVSPEEGYSDTLQVALGDSMIKGDVLATISVDDLDNDIEDLQMDLLDAQLDLQRTVLDYQNSQTETEFDIAELKEDIAELIRDQSKYAKLVTINNARQSELDDINDELKEQQQTLAEKQRSRKQDAKVHELDVAAGQALIKQYQVRLARAQKALAQTTIRAPMNGEIMEIQDTVAVPGSYLDEGDEMFTIGDTSSAVFDLELSEEYSTQVKLGDAVRVTVGNQTVTGVITSIGRIASTSDDGLGATVEIEVTPQQASADYLAGSTAIGLFTLGVQRAVLTLPRGAYLTTGAQKYVYVIDGNKASKRAVTFGEIAGNTVQVTSGLNAGDEVIVSGYQNFISSTEVTLAGDKS